MIKAEVVFDKERIIIGKYSLVADSYIESFSYFDKHSKNIWRVEQVGTYGLPNEKIFESLEQAIKYCMEN